MPIYCWAPECTHNNVADDCKFFRFPLQSNPVRRKRWLQLIRRDGTPGTGARICSCHFRDKNKDNDPEIFERNKQKLFKEHYLSPEKKKSRVKAKRKLCFSYEDDADPSTKVIAGYSSQDEPMPGPSTREPVPGQSTRESMPGPSTSEPMPGPSTSEPMPGPSMREPMPGPSMREPMPGPSTSEPMPGPSIREPMANPPTRKTDILLSAEIYLLKMEVERSNKIIKTMRSHFSFTHICEDDALILEYTGLPNGKIFKSLFFILQDLEVNYYLKWKVEKLNKEDQILITLMKLRQNFTYTDLAYRFNVSKATVSNVVVTFTQLFHDVLFVKLMSTIPKRSKNRSCLPNCASTFTNCRIILDCTEVFSAVPRQSMKHQKLTYSAYKHRNTLKALVGVSPNGVITYASNLFPGSTSDKIIVKSCRVLDQMEPGDLILADKGFLIKDILPNGVTVNIPPFLSTAQFTPEQVRRTECIARARIHVERAIRRMKSYKILGFIPVPLFKYSSIIFKAVAALTNLQYPLIKEVSQFYIDDEEES